MSDRVIGRRDALSCRTYSHNRSPVINLNALELGADRLPAPCTRHAYNAEQKLYSFSNDPTAAKYVSVMSVGVSTSA